MTADDLGQWYYLIYILPFALSFVMMLASAFGGVHRGGMRAGHGHGAGRMGARAGGGVRHHGGARSASRSGSRGSSQKQGETHAADAHVSSHHPVRDAFHVVHLHPVLGFFGIGRVPGMLLWQGFGLSWGAIGFYTSRMMEQGGQSPVRFVLPAMGYAALGGLAGSKLMAAIAARIMPSEESFAMDKEELIGLIGTVVFPISTAMGRVHVYDAYGTLHDESARLCPDETVTLNKGESVTLMDFNVKSGCYLVERSPI